jgi:hypothetical protein
MAGHIQYGMNDLGAPTEDNAPANLSPGKTGTDHDERLKDTYGMPKEHVSATPSHVNLDHFDPEGVQALRRSMSRASESRQPVQAPAPPLPNRQQTRGSEHSEATLRPGDGPFNFEKTLRTVIQRSI